MAFTQLQLDAIDKAIATGELTVTYADKSVTYRSIPDLERARDLIVTQMAGVATPFVRTSIASFDKDHVAG